MQRNCRAWLVQNGLSFNHSYIVTPPIIYDSPCTFDLSCTFFASAGGSYIELETGADPNYDATGLMRMHVSNCGTGESPTASFLLL